MIRHLKVTNRFILFGFTKAAIDVFQAYTIAGTSFRLVDANELLH